MDNYANVNRITKAAMLFKAGAVKENVIVAAVTKAERASAAVVRPEFVDISIPTSF